MDANARAVSAAMVILWCMANLAGAQLRATPIFAIRHRTAIRQRVHAWPDNDPRADARGAHPQQVMAQLSSLRRSLRRFAARVIVVIVFGRRHPETGGAQLEFLLCLALLDAMQPNRERAPHDAEHDGIHADQPDP